MRYTTRDVLRVRRWWLDRQLDVQRALIRHHERKAIEQIEQHGKARGSTNRKLYHAEQRLDALVTEAEAIDALFAEAEGLAALA